jgi:hypothetical protein
MAFFRYMEKLGLLMLVLVIFPASCKYESELPKEIPDSLKITYVDETNNRNYFESIEIRNDAVTISYDRNKRSPDILNIKLSDKEKNWIYKGFVENEFDLIEPKKPDEAAVSAAIESGTESYRVISLEVDDNRKTVKYGKNFLLSKKDQVRFNSLWTDIIEFEVTCCPSGRKRY